MRWWRKLIRWLLRLLGLIDDRPMPVSNMTLEIEMGRATLNWTLPIERADGVPLPASEIAQTDISMSADGGANFSPTSPVLPTDPQTFVVDNLTAGTYLFRATVIDTLGQASGDAEVTGSILAPPTAITDLSVTID